MKVLEIPTQALRQCASILLFVRRRPTVLCPLYAIMALLSNAVSFFKRRSRVGEAGHMRVMRGTACRSGRQQICCTL